MDELRSLALRRVSIREYAASELRAYLIRKGATPAEAEQIVTELIDEGRVDDRRYARAIARHHAFRDKGPAYVMAKLREKGVFLSRSQIQEIYDEVLPDQFQTEVELARRVVERRYPRARTDMKEKQKAYQALMRRGFSAQVVQRALVAENDGFETETKPTR